MLETIGFFIAGIIVVLALFFISATIIEAIIRTR